MLSIPKSSPSITEYQTSRKSLSWINGILEGRMLVFTIITFDDAAKIVIDDRIAHVTLDSRSIRVQARRGLK
nr:hypothetical protein [Candidatus Sigynarchaeum springense]